MKKYEFPFNGPKTVEVEFVVIYTATHFDRDAGPGTSPEFNMGRGVLLVTTDKEAADAVAAPKDSDISISEAPGIRIDGLVYEFKNSKPIKTCSRKALEKAKAAFDGLTEEEKSALRQLL